jgi:uncharacterized protein YdaT
MPWYHGTYPPSYKNSRKNFGRRQFEFANDLVAKGAPEGIIIATESKKSEEIF